MREEAAHTFSAYYEGPQLSLTALIHAFPWVHYSKKLRSKIDNPRNGGFFTAEESAERGVRLVEGVDGSAEDGNVVHFYWLVDLADGMIIDAKFQVFGQTALIGAAEIACDMLVGKNYDQAKRITAELIDKQVQDRGEKLAFPPETFPHLNLVISAIVDAADHCEDIPVSASYVAPPMPTQGGMFEGTGYPGWDELPHPQKLTVIEQVLDQEIRPYIALDAGGLEVVSLVEHQLLVRYHGACTSCYSSVGATLNAIQQMLRAKVHPHIQVTPEM